jgi:hypothetical protein
MSTFAPLNRRYLRISKYTTLEVRIYLHPDLIPTFTDDLLKVHPSGNVDVETHHMCPTTHNTETQRRKRKEK